MSTAVQAMCRNWPCALIARIHIGALSGSPPISTRVPSCHSAIFGVSAVRVRVIIFVGEIQPLRPFGECMSPGAAHPDAFSEGE